MKYADFDSPIGRLTVATDGTTITELHIEGDRYFTEVPRNWILDPDEPLLQKAQKELDKYFAGTLKGFRLPLGPKGTAFQLQVWDALQQIPPGETTTYSTIAEKIGKPNAVRAVGTAIGRNPICILTPCHRVVASNGTLGGYVAGLKRKQMLLALES